MLLGSRQVYTRSFFFHHFPYVQNEPFKTRDLGINTAETSLRQSHTAHTAIKPEVKYDPEIGVVVFDQETLAEDP